ncbi:MAG: SanA/YdcF family protein [Anaerovoracaceae bacterium]
MFKLIRGLFTIVTLLIIFAVGALAVNIYVKYMGSKHIIATSISTDAQIAKEEITLAKEKNADCILVLGAAAYQNEPSKMLRDRLDVAIMLYFNGVAPKLLMSGDNRYEDYNEVAAMNKYAQEQGVPAEDIFLDYAGFSTYESIYRAQAIFKVEKAIVVSQRYHEYRAMYISEKLGLNAWGVCSDQKVYPRQNERDLREILARDKDFLMCIFKPKPTFLGNEIPINGDGSKTHNL